jgi:hypothetical protein
MGVVIEIYVKYPRGPTRMNVTDICSRNFLCQFSVFGIIFRPRNRDFGVLVLRPPVPVLHIVYAIYSCY